MRTKSNFIGSNLTQNILYAFDLKMGVFTAEMENGSTIITIFILLQRHTLITLTALRMRS